MSIELVAIRACAARAFVEVFARSAGLIADLPDDHVGTAFAGLVDRWRNGNVRDVRGALAAMAVSASDNEWPLVLEAAKVALHEHPFHPLVEIASLWRTDAEWLARHRALLAQIHSDLARAAN